MLGPLTLSISFDGSFLMNGIRLIVSMFGVNIRVKLNNGAEVQMCSLKLLLIRCSCGCTKNINQNH